MFALTVAGALTASTAHADTGESLESHAYVKMPAAASIALKPRQGLSQTVKLERERGGSGLRYSFDIRAYGVTYEVGVDAMNGRVMENAREGAHPD